MSRRRPHQCSKRAPVTILAAVAATLSLLAADRILQHPDRYGVQGADALNRLLLERHELLPPLPRSARATSATTTSVAKAAEAGVAASAAISEESSTEVPQLNETRAVLPLADKRAAHVARVLQLRDGETMRVGVINGGIDDAAELRWLWPPGSGGRWRQELPRGQRQERLSNEELVQALSAEPLLPEALELHLVEGRHPAMAPPRVDILVAAPSVTEFKRRLRQLVQLGFGTLVVCDAAGASKKALNSQLLHSDSEELRRILIDGITQSGDTHLPRIVLATEPLGELLEEDGRLDELVPRSGSVRFVADQSRGPRFFEAAQVALAAGWREDEQEAAAIPRILLALGPGPSGSWLECEEQAAFEQARFQKFIVGPRPVSADVAACSALALAVNTVQRWETQSI